MKFLKPLFVLLAYNTIAAPAPQTTQPTVPVPGNVPVQPEPILPNVPSQPIVPVPETTPTVVPVLPDGPIESGVRELTHILDQAIEKASSETLDSVKATIKAETAEFISEQLAMHEFIPPAVRDQIQTFIENKIVAKAADAAANTIRTQLLDNTDKLLDVLVKQAEKADASAGVALKRAQAQLKESLKIVGVNLQARFENGVRNVNNLGDEIKRRTEEIKERIQEGLRNFPKWWPFKPKP